MGYQCRPWFRPYRDSLPALCIIRCSNHCQITQSLRQSADDIITAAVPEIILYFRITTGKFCHPLGDHLWCTSLYRSQIQGSGYSFSKGTDLILRLLYQCYDLIPTMKQELANFCKLKLFLLPFKQFYSQFLLQLMNLSGQRWLCNMQILRCSRNIQFPCCFHKIPN